MRRTFAKALALREPDMQSRRGAPSARRLRPRRTAQKWSSLFVTVVMVGATAGITLTAALPSPAGSVSCDWNVDASGGHGPLTTIQAGIDAVTAPGQIVCVYPGLYNMDHATNRDPNSGGSGSNDFNIFVGANATGATFQGLDGSGNPITAAPEGALPADAPVIEAAGIFPTFGSSNIFVAAPNVTLRGLEINGDPNFIAKSLEIDANNVTVTDVAFAPSTVYSGAGDLAPSTFHGGTGIYISDFNFNTGSNTSTIPTYTFTDNTFDGGNKGAGIYVANGAGWNNGPSSGRVISGNKFSATDDAIDFAGPTPNIAWLLYPVGAATITGNTFSHTVNRHVLVWGSGGPGVGYTSPDWCGIMSTNAFDAGSFTWQGTTACPGGTARTWAEPSGSGGGNYTNIAGLYSTIQQYAINKSLAGDTVQVLAGNYPEDVTIGHQLTLVGAQAGVDARPRSYPPAPSSESVIRGIGSGYTWPVWVQANDVTVDGFAVEGGDGCCGGAGVYLAGTHGTRFVNNIVTNNTVGLFLANTLGSDPTLIQHNLFADNTHPGSASGNDIYADEFTAGGAVTGATIDANKFTNTGFVENSWAVDMSNVGLPQFSNIVVSNNSIDNHGRGVLFYATANSSVIGNTFTPGAMNHYGVALCGDDPSCYTHPYTPPGIPNTNISITLNSLGCGSCVGQGVEVLDANGTSSGLLINRNDLHGLPVGISNDAPSSVNGTCNWWGSATGPAVGQKSGAVTSSPWLTVASPLATAPCTGGLPLGGGGGWHCSGTPGPLSAPLTPTAAAEAFPGAAVSWAPPLKGCPAGYVVTPYLNGVGQTPTVTFGPGTTTVIKGLIAGATYTFTVAAHDGTTVGPASVMTRGAVTIGAPAAATALRVAKVGKGTVKVTFAPARNNGAPITKYTAMCTSKNGGVTRTNTGNTSPLKVTGLTSGKTYTCTVRATNKRGTGPASSRSGAVKA